MFVNTDIFTVNGARHLPFIQKVKKKPIKIQRENKRGLENNHENK